MKVSNTGRSAPPLFCHRAARIPGRQKILLVCVPCTSPVGSPRKERRDPPPESIIRGEEVGVPAFLSRGAAAEVDRVRVVPCYLT